MDFTRWSIRTLEIACMIWLYRKNRLIKQWLQTDDPVRKERLDFIMDGLIIRIKDAQEQINHVQYTIAQQQLDADNRTVLLVCRNIDCRNHPSNPNGIGVGMKSKDYKPGEVFCEACGGELISKEEENAIESLWDFGINL